MSERAAWQPPEAVTAHDGTPLSADLDFFAAPPREIGPILSAYSTLKINDQAGRGFIRAAIVGAGLLLGIGVGFFVPTKRGGYDGVIFGAGLGGIFGLMFAKRLASNHRCHYVGRDGLATFEWTSGPNQADHTTVLAFEDAISLRTEIVDMTHNGVYGGTKYSFTWDRVSPLPRFQFKGSHGHKSGPFPVADPINFGFAADRAWTAHKLPKLRAEYERTGVAEFPLRPKGYLRASPQGIEVDSSNGKHSFLAEDIGSITVERGFLIIRRSGKPGGFFSTGEGSFSLRLELIPDYNLFLIVANNLLLAAT